MSNRQTKNAIKLFLLLLFFLGIPYLFSAVRILRSGSFILWTYDAEVKSSGIIEGIVPYMKDFLCVVLFTYLCTFGTIRSKRIMLYFSGIVCYGVLILLLNSLFKDYSTRTIILGIIAGVRNYLFFAVGLMLCSELQNSAQRDYCLNCSLHVLRIVLWIQFSVTFVSVLLSNSFSKLGVGGYRIPGAFANSGTLGCFCIGMSLTIGVYYCVLQKIKIWEFFIDALMVVFMVFASGMRSAQLCVMLFLLISVLYVIRDIFHIGGYKQILFSLISILIFFAPSANAFIVARTQRGGYADSAIGRLATASYLFNQNFFQLVFGNGLGVGTNAAVSLGSESARIFDGTLSTTLGQFGLFGLFPFLYLTVKVLYKLWKNSGPYKSLTFGIIVTIVIIFLTGNFFEQFVMVEWTIVSAWVLMNHQMIIGND